MISQEEIRQAMRGCLRLFKGEARGVEDFNLTVDGFWRSFWAAPLTAPAYGLMMWLQPDHGDGAGPQGAAFALAGSLSFLIGWLSFPILSYVLCKYYSLTGRYVHAVVVSNWMALPQIAIFASALLLSLAMSEGLASLLMLITTVAVIYVQWFALQSALATTRFTALAFLVLDMLLNQTFRALLERGLA